MIDDATKNRILDTAQVLDVVSEFVTLRRRGTNYIGLCPFHNERTPSFNVNPARNIFKCFGCGKSGDAARFLMEHEQMTFPEALHWLANKYGIPIEERELSDEERQAQSRRESVAIINEYACSWFQQQLTDTENGRAIGLAYLRSRGFRDDIIAKFRLGYCPEGQDTLIRDALAHGYKEEFLVEAGVAYALEGGRLRDRFHGRVMFPIQSLSGKVIAFSGRVMQKDAKTAKYVNSPESPVYSKSNELYGIWQAKGAIVKNDKCYLVEGNTDVVSMHQAGVENVVASCGTSLTTGQIRKIHRFTSNITVLYDGDSAGIHASLRGIDMLLEEGMNVKVVLLPDGEDPDSYARAHNATEFCRYIDEHEVDFIRFKTNLLLADAGEDPFRRADVIKSIVSSIAVIPEAIVRSTCITACSQMLHTDEQLLITAVDNIRRQTREKRNNGNGNVNGNANPAAPSYPSSNNPSSSYPSPNNPSSSNPSSNTQPASSNAPASPEVPVSDGTAVADSPQPAPTTPTAQPAPISTPVLSPLAQKERLLVQQLIRHGNEIICNDLLEDGTEVPVTVAEFIIGDLQADDLSFSEPLFRQVVDEYLLHIGDSAFRPDRHFLHHTDERMSNLAAELLSDRYELSHLFPNKSDLQDIVPHLINDYKMAIVERELADVLVRLKDPATSADPVVLRQVMSDYNALIKARKALALQLGERVIVG